MEIVTMNGEDEKSVDETSVGKLVIHKDNASVNSANPKISVNTQMEDRDPSDIEDMFADLAPLTNMLLKCYTQIRCFLTQRAMCRKDQPEKRKIKETV